MRSITAAILIAMLCTLPAVAQSLTVEQGSLNLPTISSTDPSGSSSVKFEAYGVKSEPWGVKSGSWGVQSIEPVKGLPGEKQESANEMLGARVTESQASPTVTDVSQ